MLVTRQSPPPQPFQRPFLQQPIRPGLIRRFTDPWLNPFLNGTYAAPYWAWGQASGFLAMAVWIFVILGVMFMIFFGGPRY
jgi:hypothetical protein